MRNIPCSAFALVCLTTICSAQTKTTPTFSSAPTASAITYGQTLANSVLMPPQATVSTLAGSGSFYTDRFVFGGFADGPGTVAQFSTPVGMAIDGSGNVYVADPGNNRIRKITPEGTVTTLAGSGTAGFADGAATVAQFKGPEGVAVDGSGNVYVADTTNNRIRKVTSEGMVTTLAGSGLSGSFNGTGNAAFFAYPKGVALDAAGNVYVADTYTDEIRKVTASGVVTTLAGSTQGYADGIGTAAKFNFPGSVTVDGAGNVYVADCKNNRIRKVTPEGTVTTLAGSGTAGFADGAATVAQFKGPFGVSVDGYGNVYVADSDNHRIRKVTPDGMVTTLAGGGGGLDIYGVPIGGYADGSGTTAQFAYPFGIAVDGSGNVYVADSYNNRIRKVTPAVSTEGVFAFASPSTKPNVGTSSYSVTFTPTDTANYNTVTTTVSVTVSKATPSITIAPTASLMIYGQTLAESTLTSGTASIGGSFAFTSPSTVPAVGTSSQSVAFVPTDTANYNTVNTSVNVTVLDPDGDENGDGISNGVSVLLGYDPYFNFGPLLNHLKSNPVSGLFNQSQYNLNRVNGRNDVINSPNSYDLYTTSQIQNIAIGDLVLTREVNGNFVLNYDIEQSTDLQTWTPYQALSLPLTGLPTDKAFVRIKVINSNPPAIPTTPPLPSPATPTSSNL